MEMLVAKSYQGLPIVKEPYNKSGKTYCVVKLKSGKEKEVRVYSQKEYDKMYPAPPVKWKPQREMLGFGKDGYILVFNTGPNINEQFYVEGPFRFHRVFGWYLPSNETVPVLPEGVMPKVLRWEMVGGDDGELFAEDHLIKQFNKIIRDARFW